MQLPPEVLIHGPLGPSSFFLSCFPLSVVVQLLNRLWLCDPLDCSMPGSSVLHCLPGFAQTRFDWIGDGIQPSHFSCPQSFLASRSFPVSQLFSSGGQSIGASPSASVLPVNSQGWFPLGLTSLSPCCPRDSQESFPAPQFESISSSVLCLLYGPTLTSIHDHWKNHSFDSTDLCWQSDVSVF